MPKTNCPRHEANALRCLHRAIAHLLYVVRVPRPRKPRASSWPWKPALSGSGLQLRAWQELSGSASQTQIPAVRPDKCSHEGTVVSLLEGLEQWPCVKRPSKRTAAGGLRTFLLKLQEASWLLKKDAMPPRLPRAKRPRRHDLRLATSHFQQGAAV